MIVVRLIIDFNGSDVRMDGPIDNQMLCYGLLEMAKDAIRNHAAQSQKRIVPANGVVLPSVKPS